MNGIYQDSDESSNSEDADVNTQNLQNEIKRQRLITSPQLNFEHNSETEDSDLNIERNNIVNEPSTSFHHQNIPQVQIVENSETEDSLQVTEGNNNDRINISTIDDVLLQDRNNASTEVTLSEEIQNAISNQDNTSSELQDDSFINMKLSIQIFKGHSDMIQMILRDENIILSASSDTTIKVWNIQGEEICSLRGHIGPVKGITLFSIDDSKDLARKLNCCQTERIAISGSQDCSIKVWMLPSGKQVKSIYVFNGITCLFPLEDYKLLIGTESGKIEIWNILEDTNIYSIQAYDDLVLTLQFNNQHVFSLSKNGILKVWYYVNQQLEDHTQNIEFQNQNENWICFSLYDDKLYLASNEWDIYILSLAANKMEIFKKSFYSKGYFHDNYQINTMCIAEDKLLLAKYNHKSNVGCIDVYSFPDCNYNYSLIGEISFVKCISFSQLSDNNCCLITGGKELIVWNLFNANNQNDDQYNEDATSFSIVSKITNVEEEENSRSFKILKNYFKNKDSKFYSINKFCHIL